MTSTTSLSDDCDSLKIKKRASIKSSSSFLIDFSSPKSQEEERLVVGMGGPDGDDLEEHVSLRSSPVVEPIPKEEENLLALDSTDPDTPNTLGVTGRNGSAALPVDKLVHA